MKGLAVRASTVHGATFPRALLTAPAHWRQLDFIADLHLQASDSATFSAWRDYMLRTQADALFILGDLFEVWVGDDEFDDGVQHGRDGGPTPTAGLAARCAEVIEATSRRLSVYFMHGNRDFLLGPVYAQVCGMVLLDDPSVLEFAGQRWLLSHGDALCLADTDYLQFRSQVRSEQWRREFLARPLAERQLVGRQLRSQSEARKSSNRATGAMLADLDNNAVRDWLLAADAGTLIHGHTHQPAEHDLGNGQRRHVLSDWDGSASPVRASILRLNTHSRHQGAAGATVERLTATCA